MAIIDARTNQQDQHISADICIIGGGPAGITLATEFIGQAANVVLLESGGFEAEADTQALYDGESAGIPYNLIATRLRMLGGSSNHWAGMGNPLAPMDFEQRDWVPHSGWPITRAELEPYYQRAIPFMGWASMNFTPEYWEERTKDPRFLHFPLESDAFRSVVFQYSEPTRRFGKDYRARLEQASNIQLLLHANVTEFEVTDNTREVTSVGVQCLNQTAFRVKAKIFILATGGIENARILLASTQTHNAGLGNDHDLVGRFFMEHTRVNSGPILPLSSDFSETYKFYRAVLIDQAMHIRLRLLIESTAAFQRDHQTLNLHANLRRVMLNNDAEALALRSVLDDIGEQKPGALASAGASAKDLLRKLRDLATDTPPAASGPEILALMLHGEQAPNPDSRVLLSDQLDPLGMPRTKLDWRLTELDRSSFAKTRQAFARAMGASSLGRQRDDVPKTPQDFDKEVSREVEYHHMGTTRMSADPRQGVVDPQCRIHGMANLYIAGSSVFPTSGAANPTFTILALTLRLADHLKQSLKQGDGPTLS